MADCIVCAPTAARVPQAAEAAHSTPTTDAQIVAAITASIVRVRQQQVMDAALTALRAPLTPLAREALARALQKPALRLDDAWKHLTPREDQLLAAIEEAARIALGWGGQAATPPEPC